MYTFFCRKRGPLVLSLKCRLEMPRTVVKAQLLSKGGNTRLVQDKSIMHLYPFYMIEIDENFEASTQICIHSLDIFFYKVGVCYLSFKAQPIITSFISVGSVLKCVCVSVCVGG